MNEDLFLTACLAGDVDTVTQYLKDIDINKPYLYRKDSGFQLAQTPLMIASEYGHDEVVSILLADERIKVNKEGEFGSALLLACKMGRANVVSKLLAHKDIDVNMDMENMCEYTPFSIACRNGHAEIVSHLLKDSRLDLKKERKARKSPFKRAYNKGHTDVLKEFMYSFAINDASSLSLSPESFFKEASKFFNSEPLPLLKGITSEDIKSIQNKIAADYFCLIVFLSDGYLKEKEGKIGTKQKQFCSILKVLPIELQMTICLTAVGSADVIISTTDSEPGFRSLTRYYELTKTNSTAIDPVSLDNTPQKAPGRNRLE